MRPPFETPFSDEELFERAWEKTRAVFGRDFTFYLPGMIRLGKQRGRYPALSITGDRCTLLCEHCRGRLLAPMLHVREPGELMERCRRMAKGGSLGVLLSGGADHQGKLPWAGFLDAISIISRETNLFISAHVGFPDLDTCQGLHEAGVRQALIDAMGDDETAFRVYHLPGLRQVKQSLDSIAGTGLQLVPHIVTGLYFGRMRSEYRALELLSRYEVAALVIVVLTPLKGTPMAGVSPPSPSEVARLIAQARLMMPRVPISLGCERPRNSQGLSLEKLAIRAGATRMAVWSEEAIAEARGLGLNPRFQYTCCSVEFRKEFESSGESE
jgi:lipoyl synthase